jgi:DNA-binding ferritin-like protein (Dps family)
MNFWEKITGNDMTKLLKSYESRAKELPLEYQKAWKELKVFLWPHSDLSGRNLMPILDGVLGLFEESVVDGESVHEVLGDDIRGFCSALVGEDGAKTYRDRWREQLNSAITRKLKN